MNSFYDAIKKKDMESMMSSIERGARISFKEMGSIQGKENITHEEDRKLQKMIRKVKDFVSSESNFAYKLSVNNFEKNIFGFIDRHTIIRDAFDYLDLVGVTIKSNLGDVGTSFVIKRINNHIFHIARKAEWKKGVNYYIEEQKLVLEALKRGKDKAATHIGTYLPSNKVMQYAIDNLHYDFVKHTLNMDFYPGRSSEDAIDWYSRNKEMQRIIDNHIEEYNNLQKAGQLRNEGWG